METVHLFSLPRTAKWRAKLCRLGYESWQVFREGNVYGEYDEKTDRYTLIMEDQYDPSRILFNSTIRAPVAFQKQDSLLLWNGPEEDIMNEAVSGNESEPWQDENGLAQVAFAFQVVPGCALMSEFVLHAISQSQDKQGIAFAIQQGGVMNDFANALSPIVVPPALEQYAEIVEEPIKYPPPPTRDNLAKVHSMIGDMLGNSLGRELLIVFLASKNYLDQLWTIFLEILPAEDLLKSTKIGRNEQRLSTNNDISTRDIAKRDIATGDIPVGGIAGDVKNGDAPNDTNDTFMSPLERIQLLWTISDIVKQYMTAGDAVLIDKITEYDSFLKVLSMLEYDRGFGTRKANFRDYYLEQTGMKQVIEMVDSPVLEKIQRTFRLQMLRDVLVRSSDDVTYNIIRSLINVNHIEILENLQHSPEFCAELFGLFASTAKHPVTQTLKPRDDAIEFINEVMKISKIMSVQQLRPLYIRLLESGLANAMAYGLHSERRREIKLLTLETLSIIFEFDTTLILPLHGSTILQAVVNMVYDIPSATAVDDASPSSSSPSARSSSAEASARAMQLESSDLLKKVLVDFPQETYGQFFQFLSAALSRATTATSHVVRLIPLIDILTHCFSLNPELTGDMMTEHNIWEQIARITAVELAKLGPAVGSKLSMSLIRLVRETIQPPLTVAASAVSKQATKITESGLLLPIINNMCAKPFINDAEHSSFLNFLHIIMSGRANGYRKQYKIITNWIVNSGKVDLRQLCAAYPFVRDIVPEHVLQFAVDNNIDEEADDEATEENHDTDNNISGVDDQSSTAVSDNYNDSYNDSASAIAETTLDANIEVPLKRRSSQDFEHEVTTDGLPNRRPRRSSRAKYAHEKPDERGHEKLEHEKCEHEIPESEKPESGPLEPKPEGTEFGIQFDNNDTANPKTLGEPITGDSDEVIVISREEFPKYHSTHHTDVHKSSLLFDHSSSGKSTPATRHPWWDSSHALSPRSST